MSECTEAYFNTQGRLTTWNDELEFLGYILCEILDKRELDARGFRCHQAAELPALIKVLRHQLKEPNGTLTTIMADHELQIFRRLLKKAWEMRNQMAHHQSLDDGKLDSIRDVKEQLCKMLENTIRRAASEFGTHQVSWAPYHHICNSFSEVERNSPAVTVPLNEESLLSFRDRILREAGLQQRQILYGRPKHKATEASRRKHREDLEAALRRKSQRQERDIAKRSQDQHDKLQRIQQRFTEWKEWECAQLTKIRGRMREEEDVLQRQRAEILKDNLLHLSIEEQISLMLVLLAISSPVWLMGILIYDIYRKVRAYA